MDRIPLADLLPIFESFMTDRAVAASADASVRLSEIGADSLTTISVIVAAAEKFGLNLERLDDTANPPETLGDVVTLLNRLNE